MAKKNITDADVGDMVKWWDGHYEIYYYGLVVERFKNGAIKIKWQTMKYPEGVEYNGSSVVYSRRQLLGIEGNVDKVEVY